MQTFVPYADIKLSAESLDKKRLGKQRVETLQILNCIVGGGKGWANHPAVKMWRPNPQGLAAYGIAVCKTWIALGFADTCTEKISSLIEPDEMDLPAWWGDERVHSSHRSNLVRKDPVFYSAHGWTDDPEAPYFWPV
jgi:hypothetical protein